MASDNEIMRLKATVEDDATATIAKPPPGSDDDIK